MTDTRDTAEAPARPLTLHVLFTLDGAEYVVAAADVLHMESFTGATRVPGTAAHVTGVMQIRRRVVPVIDVRQRFGLPPIAPTLDSRVVVVQDGARAVGLLVDSAREVVRLDETTFQDPPEVIDQQAGGFVKKLAQSGKRLLLLIDFQKLISEEDGHGGQ